MVFSTSPNLPKFSLGSFSKNPIMLVVSRSSTNETRADFPFSPAVRRSSFRESLATAPELRLTSSSEVSRGFRQWVITSMTFCTSSSSLFFRPEPNSFCALLLSSWWVEAISLHWSTKLALAWAVKSHRCTTPFLRLKPTFRPLVFVLRFRVCSRTCAVHSVLRQHVVSVRVGIWKSTQQCQEDTLVNTLRN